MSSSAWLGLKCLFAGGMALALVYGLVLSPPTAKLTLLSVRSDHLLHAATLSCLTLIGACLWTPAGLLAALMVTAGGLLEFVQRPVGREMSFSDWIASISA
ncbi:hypothetical protein [Oricola indica]|uniref:hypothetical protein n=1 Tax=Oricola indica TaxID=2872591 RepID=UPI001CBB8823|nr:hypothetical protein [Oricola indica]